MKAGNVNDKTIAPADAIVDVAALDVRVAPYDWPFATREATRIDTHWNQARADKPRLFDGRVLLSRSLETEPGGTLRGTAFETGFKSFMAWRDFGFPDPTVFNCFAMPALRAVDGAFVLGAMGAATANAGRLYFPAGTPEPSDADADGRVDFAGNILRELEEETGLSPSDVVLDPGWTIVFDGSRVACMRIVRCDLSLEAMQARLVTFNAGQAEPELDHLVGVRSPEDFDQKRMPDFMIRYMTHALVQP